MPTGALGRWRRSAGFLAQAPLYSTSISCLFTKSNGGTHVTCTEFGLSTRRVFRSIILQSRPRCTLPLLPFKTTCRWSQWKMRRDRVQLGEPFETRSTTPGKKLSSPQCKNARFRSLAVNWDSSFADQITPRSDQSWCPPPGSHEILCYYTQFLTGLWKTHQA